MFYWIHVPISNRELVHQIGKILSSFRAVCGSHLDLGRILYMASGSFSHPIKILWT